MSGTSAAPGVDSEWGVSGVCRGLLTVTLTWRRNAAARPCPPMATHANPGCGTDCRKHARTQLHRPDRPEPHRPRHALAVPSPQARASSLGSAAQPGRAGPGAAWEERGVVHGVYWIQFCIANANLHALRAGRKPPLFPCDTPAGPHALVAQTPHFATKPPRATQTVKPARVAHVERL